jgi:uncharacterized heparinase superfamily protein
MQGPSPLWRYHLHYHEHLADAAWLASSRGDSSLARRVLSDAYAWQQCWASGGSPAWDAYPSAVRLVSWLRIIGFAGPLLPDADSDFLRAGVAVHYDHLARNIEWHLEGNHLLRDAWALALGAACLSHPSFSRAAAKAFFERVLLEQVHHDGWHEERSPMYHARALRDAIEVEEVYRSIGSPLSAESSARIASMRESLWWMLRANGELWQLNDSALDHGVNLAPLLPNSSRPTDGVKWFADSGTVSVVSDRGDRLRLDFGGPAPAHQPGHAHGGALGFEFDVVGHPLIIDGGVAGYDGDPWRDWLRGSAAHSTLVIDGKNQNENWGTFRIGARARVVAERVEGDSHSFFALGTCVPYHSNITHRREFRRVGRTLHIHDCVENARGRQVESFLHFAPEWIVSRVSESVFEARKDDIVVSITIEAAATVSLHRGEHNPTIGWRARGFGDVVPAFAIRVRAESYQGDYWRTQIESD